MEFHLLLFNGHYGQIHHHINKIYVNGEIFGLSPSYY